MSNMSPSTAGEPEAGRGASAANRYHAPFEAATSEVARDFPGVSARAAALLTLLAFMANPGSMIQVDFLSHAFQTKKLPPGLDDGVVSAINLDGHLEPFHLLESCSQSALAELSAAGAISWDVENERVAVDDSVGNRLLSALAKYEEVSGSITVSALIVACRAVPFKYLDPPADADLRDSLKSRLEYTSEAVRARKDGFGGLSKSVRIAVTLCLVEASRFPGMQWKRSTVALAREIMGSDSNDLYCESSVAQREVLTHRLDGRLREARDAVQNLLSRHAAAARTGEAHAAQRLLLHAAAGHAVVESALNDFQEEQLVSAIAILDSWEPQSQLPSIAEIAVLLRSSLLKAKILRCQGEFASSLEYLDICQDIIDRHHPASLVLDEQLPALACERADALRELDRPVEAEEFARTSIDRAKHNRCSTVDFQLLSICLAEALFAQGNVAEAEAALANKSAVAPSSSKLVRLRLSVTMAKIHHSQPDLACALPWWTQASEAINKFPYRGGHATRTIYLSIVDILRRQGDVDSLEQTLKRLRELEGCPLDRYQARFWIAGLQSWREYIDKDRRRE